MLRDAGYLLLLVSIPALVLVHLSIAPYTKVEESFHIQAIHDIETYGIPTHNIKDVLRTEYDHFTFPGAVPRTFAGAVALSGLSSPFIWLKHDIDRQFLGRFSPTRVLHSRLANLRCSSARAFLGLFNACSLLYFAGALRRAAGKPAAVWYLLFQASQFHIIYYASRTLSNMFAFGITTFALASLLPEPGKSATYRKRSRVALYLITIAGIVFRAELALFLATHTLLLFASGRISIRREIIPAGISGVLLGLAITLPVDSFFWQQFPLWPELAAFKFNVVAGQSSAWGTHPWHYYFSNALPRLLLNPLTYLIGVPISLLQPATRPTARSLLIPSLTYIALYSAQPHKEWRFIVYAIPPLTAAAAQGASYIWTHRAKSVVYRFLSLGLIASTLASFLLSSFVLLPASSANYPGALALNTLHSHVHNAVPKTQDPIPISVHLGNLACQTGVTRFLQQNGPSPSSSTSVSWTYDKSPPPTLPGSDEVNPTFWARFDYVLLDPTEAESLLSLTGLPNEYAHSHSYAWSVVGSVNGFAGLRVVKPSEEASRVVEGGILHWISGGKGGVWGVDVSELWRDMRKFLRKKVTKGWWVEVRMEERIRILGRVR
ncbi:dolichyl-P-Man:Man(7)GlcNAc(2)-PP-dolichol alpha-1,6-mannosyltransferase [Aspergillus undulatus]|uniref:dolichyl-P-Man:Man(7)GlcNAc(2)-PP-dolichol alpha-1,6-mannosyltransferase n=1 Tax=Aspergillus undulatus TaxID=1810928 RepID=UPI003CCDD4D0